MDDSGNGRCMDKVITTYNFESITVGSYSGFNI